ALRNGLRTTGPGVLWAVWLALELSFLAAGAPFGSARYVLPVVVPLAIACGRAWRRLALGERALGATVIAQAALALLVGAARLAQARAYQRAPAAVAALGQPAGRSWFVGDWGFQLHMKEAGHAYLHQTDALCPGDRVVRAVNLTAEPWRLNAHVL